MPGGHVCALKSTGRSGVDEDGWQGEDMWYSKFSTGMLEVDNQHGNIDSVTILYENDTNAANETKWLAMIFDTIRLHFEFEEILFGKRMPAEHKAEHIALIEHIKTILGKRKQQEIPKPEVINTIRGFLVSHVTEFDLKFKELKPGAGVQTAFRSSPRASQSAQSVESDLSAG
jgi:hemerythrin-like metal-binding protein